MLVKSLTIFIGIGVLAGLLFGIWLIDVKNPSQLVFVEGTSVSIVTEKFDFKSDELIKIRVINSGTVPLSFPDLSYGIRITGLSGILIYSPITFDEMTSLDPGDEIELLWDQIKNDGDIAHAGLYKISTKASDKMGNNIEKSTTITIWK